MTEDEVKRMIRRLMNKPNDDAYLLVLGKLQKDTGFLDLAFERVRLPATGKWYVCLVNKEKDEAAKLMGSKFTAEQREFFRIVVETICGAQPPEGKLIADASVITLVNVDVTRQGAAATQATAKAKKLSAVEKERTLSELEAGGWLYKSRDGYFTLGPRTLGELKELVLSVVSSEVAEELSAEYM